VQEMGLSDFWEVESAAILEYHVGKGPEPRAIATLRKAGITNYSHIARQVSCKFYINAKFESGIILDHNRRFLQVRLDIRNGRI